MNPLVVSATLNIISVALLATVSKLKQDHVAQGLLIANAFSAVYGILNC
jgi:hypothetical protein